MAESWTKQLVTTNRLSLRMRLQVLRVLLDADEAGSYGYALMRASRIPRSPLYRILHELVDQGWAESFLEDGNPRILGRKLRRYYVITEHGRAEIELLHQSLLALLLPPALAIAAAA